MTFKDEVEFERWCRKVGYDEQTRRLIQRIRTSPPSRSVTSRRGNVSARLPSHKMGLTIQSESRTAEKPGLRIFYEYDHLLERGQESAVLEYYDQPDNIALKYASTTGRAVTAWHTPDFFVIRESGAGWEEWKTEAELVVLAQKHPTRYHKDGMGQWRCLPGEAYAAQFGLSYRLRSNAEVDWTLFSNLEFLHDYLVVEDDGIEPSTSQGLLKRVGEQQGITLRSLLQDQTADTVYLLIARRQLYVDLHVSRLVEPEHVQVYTSRAAAEAYQHVNEAQPKAGNNASSLLTTHPPHWISATEQDYAVANARWCVLQGLEKGLSLEQAWKLEGVATTLGTQKTSRTIRFWRQQFRESEQCWGNGYVGLLPQIYQRGNRQRKLSEQTWEKMQLFIEMHYEEMRQPYMASVWARYCQACEQEGITPASQTTFGKAVKQRPQEIQVRKRQGKRAAHQVQKRYWQLEATTPKHGERIWQIVHLDHTRLDIQLRHARTGALLGRPWATFAVDAYSRRLLAVVLTLDDQPSYRTCMLVLRELVRRFQRLPQTLYVDNGKEFHSTYFQALLAQYGVEVAYRPSGQPRFGDVVERLFRTANTQFIYNLTGNTQLTRQIRLVTKSHDPRQLALWTLEELSVALQDWAYEVYDQSLHTSLGQSPREVFEDSLLQHGERAFKDIDYNSFTLNALPAPANGTQRKVHPSGVKIDHIYYWHDHMYRPDILGTRVSVRYDPFNAGLAYAYLDKAWVRCTSEHFATFHNRSEQELQIAREELCAGYRQQGQQVRTVNARLLANFLERTTASERLLKQQQCDNAMRFVLGPVTEPLVQEALETQREEVTPYKEDAQKKPLVSYTHLTLPDDF